MGSFRRLHRQEEPTEPDPGSDPAYLNWLRRQPCAHCGHIAPSEAHHSTVAPSRRGASKRGKGEKSDDRFAFPLYFKCHRAFHYATGDFREWDKAKRRAWQEEMSAKYRDIYLDTLSFF